MIKLTSAAQTQQPSAQTQPRSKKASPAPNAIILDRETAEDLHNLLYQLNWLNDIMKSDKSNAIINALLLSIDPANKTEICEAVESLSRINLSDEVIKRAIGVLEKKGGLQ